MKLAKNPFTHAIAKGEKQIGIWVSLTSPYAADAIAGSDYDWALIDMEHSPNDIQSTYLQLKVFEGSGTTPMVRVPWNDTVTVKRVMDIGAPGLIFPMVQSVEEAERAVAATRYPPRGVRGVAGMTAARKFGRVTDYVARVEEETAVILQLETAHAVGQAEAIAGVDGVSGVFFGPADISADIGKGGNPMDPAVWDLVMPAAEKLIAKGIPVGTLVLDPARGADLLNAGFTFVACAMDAALLAKAADQTLAVVKDALK